MSEQTEGTPVTSNTQLPPQTNVTVGEPVAPVSTEEQRVPYDRFKSVNDQLGTTKAELEELRAWKQEQEAAQLSEIERATKERDEALAAASAATERATTLERSGWVAEAARTAGFADPSDAAAFLALSDLADKDAAAAAVSELAKNKPHLLTSQKPQGFGSVTGQPRSQQGPPLDADGKPDLKAGLGTELLNGLLGGGKR